MKVIYTAEATARGGRGGSAETSDGALRVNLVRPKEMGGTGEAGTNPEQLFACGYAACFISTIEFLARQKKLAVGEVAATTRVGIGPRAEGPGYGLTVAMTVSIPGLDRSEAEALLAEAHQTCPYSNATRGNIPVELTLAH